MMGSNELVDHLTVICFTAGSAVHAWEFLYGLAAVIISVRHFSQLQLMGSVVRHGAVYFRAMRISL
jgi:hypothetical protein